MLSVDDRASRIALHLDGTIVNRQSNPVMLMAASAAARAAGQASTARALAVWATSEAIRFPTYYGDAWVALADALARRLLDPCQEVANG